MKKRDHCAEANDVDCIKLLKKMTWGDVECSIGEKAMTVTENVKVTLSTKYAYAINSKARIIQQNTVPSLNCL